MTTDGWGIAGFWVAVGAAMFAGGSLAVAVIALVRSIRNTPAPDLRAAVGYDEYPDVVFDGEGDLEVDRVYITVTNRGGGRAHDVVVTIPVTSGEEQRRDLGTLGTDEEKTGTFNRLGNISYAGTATVFWTEGRRRLTMTIDY